MAKSKWKKRIHWIRNQATHKTVTIPQLARKYRVKPDTVKRQLRRNKAQLSVSDYYKRQLLGFRVNQSQRVVDVSGNEYYRFEVRRDLGEKFDKERFRNKKKEAGRNFLMSLSVRQRKGKKR